LGALEPSTPFGIVATSAAGGSAVLVGIGDTGLCETSFVVAGVKLSVMEGVTVLAEGKVRDGENSPRGTLRSPVSGEDAHEETKVSPKHVRIARKYVPSRRFKA
jgi:hypothetical protein